MKWKMVRFVKGQDNRNLPGLESRSAQRPGVATMPHKRLDQGGAAMDRQLERRIRNFLQGLNLPAFRDMEVAVRNGAAVITGRVGTFYHKQLATSCCQRVAGVQNVLNEVRVTD